MNYATFNTHKEVYKIKGVFYTVICDFFKNIGWINWNKGRIEFTLNEYENFEGNMKDFIKSKI